MKNYLLISLLVLGFAGCSTKDEFVLFNQTKIHQKPTQKETKTKFDHVKFEYKIRPHDRISVIVYKHPELSTASLNSLEQERGLLVNSKGELRLPLIKKILIAGLDQTEAEDKIMDAYKTYLKEPDIQIEVLSKRAYVIGEVKNPGEIPLINEQLSLLQVLSLAGDLTDQADRSSILIFRGGNVGEIHTELISLTDMNSLRTANLMINPNDIVYVIPNDMKAFNTRVNEIDPIFRLIGNVLSPFVNIKFLSN